jgi:hypothetical protein
MTSTRERKREREKRAIVIYIEQNYYLKYWNIADNITLKIIVIKKSAKAKQYAKSKRIWHIVKAKMWNCFFRGNIAAKCTFSRCGCGIPSDAPQKLHRKPNGKVILNMLQRNDMLLSATSVHSPDREDITQLHTRTRLLYIRYTTRE